jgi:hypothetical protein
MMGLVDQGQGHGDGGRVGVGPFDRARDEVDPALAHGQRDRGVEGAAKILAERGQTRMLGVLAEDLGQPGGILEPAHRPEIVPVGVHRLGEIPLVAHRLGQKTETGQALGRALRIGQTPGAQLLQIGDRRQDGRPEIRRELPIAGEAHRLGDGEDELAQTVVLGQPIRARVVDAAGHLAGLGLKPCIPANEVRGLGPAAHAQQGGGHDRAVADPGSGIATRSGLQAGPSRLIRMWASAVLAVAPGSGPRAAGRRRTAPSRCDQSRTASANPACRIEPVPETGDPSASDPAQGRRIEGDREDDLLDPAGRQHQIESQRTRGISRADRSPAVWSGREPRGRAVSVIAPLIEGRGAETARRAQRDHSSSLTQTAVAISEPPDRTHAADVGKALPRRRDLEGAHRDEEPAGAIGVAPILETIARIEHPLLGRAPAAKAVVASPDRRPAPLTEGIGSSPCSRVWYGASSPSRAEPVDEEKGLQRPAGPARPRSSRPR